MANPRIGGPARRMGPIYKKAGLILDTDPGALARPAEKTNPLDLYKNSVQSAYGPARGTQTTAPGKAALPMGRMTPLNATAGAPSIADTIPSGPGAWLSKIFTKENMAKVAAGAEGAVPYLSNALNAMRKPPAPTRPRQLSKVTLDRVNLDGERAAIDSQTAAASAFAGNALDGQAAAAVAGANAARGYEAKNRSWMQQAQTNTEIDNRNKQLDLSVDAQNLQYETKYNDDVIGMKLAHMREQSQNLANLSDKRVAQIANKNAMQLERDKFAILSKVYTNGIVDRVAGPDQDKALGFKHALGGKLGRMRGKIKKVY